MSQLNKKSSIPPQVYDDTYFLESMEGAAEFSLSKGENLPERMQYALNLAGIQPGQKILDLGCGRGEMAFHCARLNAYAHGLDYSNSAIRIANDLRLRAMENGNHMSLECAASHHLPYSDNSFDMVFILDLVEHLYPDELLETLIETHRILRAGGRLIIHTMPNDDYYHWGYPLYRMLKLMLGEKLPKNPRLRWYRGETHINIQNPRKLRKILIEAGFSKPKVWLQPLQGGYLTRLILRIPPWRWIFLNDIIGKAIKK